MQIAAAFLAAPATAAKESAPSVAALDGAEPFIADMRARHGFAPEELRAFLGRLKVNRRVIALMDAPAKPGRKTYWREYRRRQLAPRRIAEGAAFIRRHRQMLARAEMEYGVPGNIIAAILGVETRYGKILGDFSVAESLATLAFAYPRRGDEFRRELEEFLIYARQAAIDPLLLRGSFAGAFGMPQFLPGSARRFAVDFDGDNRIDLFSAPDAAGSIGNFLLQHGWIRGGAILYPAQVKNPAPLLKAVHENKYKPLWTPQQLAEAGVDAGGEISEELYLVVDLENRYDSEYRIGAQNFYALTRYNKSFKYATAVFDLSEALGAAAK